MMKDGPAKHHLVSKLSTGSNRETRLSPRVTTGVELSIMKSSKEIRDVKTVTLNYLKARAINNSTPPPKISHSFDYGSLPNTTLTDGKQPGQSQSMKIRNKSSVVENDDPISRSFSPSPPPPPRREDSACPSPMILTCTESQDSDSSGAVTSGSGAKSHSTIPPIPSRINSQKHVSTIKNPQNF